MDLHGNLKIITMSMKKIMDRIIKVSTDVVELPVEQFRNKKKGQTEKFS